MRKWGHWLILLFFATFPWDISKALFPPYQSAPETGATLTFMRIATVLIVLWAFATLLRVEGRQRLRKLFDNKVLWTTLAVFLAAGISYIGSVNGHNTLAEALRLAVLCALGISIALGTDEPEFYSKAWGVLVGSVTVIAVIGIGQFFAGIGMGVEGNRVYATTLDPNLLARYLDISILGTAILLLTKNWRPRIWLFLALLLQFAALVFTFSRSAWLILALGLFLITLFTPKKIKLKLIGIYVLAGGALLLIPGVQARLMTFASGGDALGPERQYLIKAGWAMIFDHPFNGVGLGNFQWALQHQYQRFLPIDVIVTRPHISVMTVAAEMGILGLLAMLIFLAGIIWTSLRFNGKAQGYLLASASGILVIWLSSQSEGRFFEDPLVWVFWGLILASYRFARNFDQ